MICTNAVSNRSILQYPMRGYILAALAMRTTLSQPGLAASAGNDQMTVRPAVTRSPRCGLRHSRFRSGPGGTHAHGRRPRQAIAVEESDHRHRQLLRASNERPRRSGSSPAPSAGTIPPSMCRRLMYLTFNEESCGRPCLYRGFAAVARASLGRGCRKVASML